MTMILAKVVLVLTLGGTVAGCAHGTKDSPERFSGKSEDHSFERKENRDCCFEIGDEIGSTPKQRVCPIACPISSSGLAKDP